MIALDRTCMEDRRTITLVNSVCNVPGVSRLHEVTSFDNGMYYVFTVEFIATLT